MDFNGFMAAIHKQYGLNLAAYKEKQLKRRIDSLIATTQAKGYQAFFELLCRDSYELERFYDKITINVSEFFRNEDIFDSLENKILPLLCSKNQKLKIWSAACSNGAEPYSIAIILDDRFPNVSYSIHATDIDANILEAARQGIYDDKALKGVSPQRLQKYFNKYDSNLYQIVPQVKRHVTFKKHDLLEDKFENGFDLIVCRNVMIYFTRESQDDLYRKMYASLGDGGILFIGATETITQYKDYGFDKVSHWFYQKPESGGRSARAKIIG